jgi:hypothetical protein
MEISDVKLIRCSLVVVPLIFAMAPVAGAQTSFDLNMGFGTARAGSNGGGIDSNPNDLNYLGPCVPTPGNVNCSANPSLGGFFLGLGGDLIFQKHLGFGAEVNFQPAHQTYGPLQSRQTFYDFNGIYVPINEKKVQIQVQGGIGGARTSFALTQNQCVGTAVCSSFIQPIGNANHFQVHVGVGVELFVTTHLFVRPQIDLHYIPSFTDQYGKNAVPEYTVWVGYSFGDRS